MKFLLPVSAMHLFPRNLKILFYPTHSPTTRAEYSSHLLYGEQIFSTSVSFWGLLVFSKYKESFHVELSYYLNLAKPKMLLLLERFLKDHFGDIHKSPENLKMRWKTGSFYGMKSKEQRREKRKMNVKQRNKYRTQGWLGD